MPCTQASASASPELELLTPSLSVASTSSTRIEGPTPSIIYSTDGSYVFHAQAHRLRVLQGASGRMLHECTRTSTSSAIVALARYSHHPHHLAVAYQDATLVIWDFLDQKPQLELHLASPVRWIASSCYTPSRLLLVLEATATTWQLVDFCLERRELERVIFTSDLAFHAGAMQSYVPSPTTNLRGDLVVLAAETSVFILWRPKSAPTDAFEEQTVHHVRAVTCVAVHPTAREVAIGDAMGQIARYDQASLTLGRGVKDHWHAHAVQCLLYSNDGRFLLSGGHECVLVTWDVESGRRAYLPRLSAPIHAIARSGAHGGVYVVALRDTLVFQYNCVTRAVEWDHRGWARANVGATKSHPTRQLPFDPRSHALVLNGASSTGLLQFYDPVTDHVLQTLALSERNQVTRTADEVVPIMVASHVRFSACGTDLATLQAPHTSKTGSDQTLCFWARRVDGSFVVETSVDAPHGAHRVTNVAFSPATQGEYVVTADLVGEFKVWQKKPSSEAGPDAVSWQCRSVVRFRDEPITAVAFARDGSLLAVAYGTKLTLWDIGTHALRRVLVTADGEKIRHIVFPGLYAPYVVLVTKHQVQVWHLVSLTLAWRYTVPNKTMVADTTWDDQFLVWMHVKDKDEVIKTLLLVFDPHTCVPTCLRVVDIDTKVWSAGFHPQSGEILLLDTQSRIWRVKGPNTTFNGRAKELERSTTSKQERETKALSFMYPAARGEKGASDEGGRATTVNATPDASSSLFDAPVHVLPSMTTLYRSFMDTMLVKTQSSVQKKRLSPDDATKPRKKTKRRKKEQEVETWAIQLKNEHRQRIKHAVDETTTPDVEQETYSTLVDTFRTTMTRRA